MSFAHVVLFFFSKLYFVWYNTWTAPYVLSHTIFLLLLTMITRKKQGICLQVDKCLKEISCLVFLSILSCLFPKYVLSDMIREHSAPNVEVNILFLTIITRDKQRICLHIVQMPSKIYFVLSFFQNMTWYLNTQPPMWKSISNLAYLVSNDYYQG